LDEAWLAAYEDAIDADLAAGQHRNLVPELTELAAEYPFREEFTAQLMLALHRSGRTVEALGVYAVAESRTRALLGTTPGQQLRHLRGAILYRPAQPAPVSYQPEATA
jgi:DNA-binding SARP family transcriptional activator